MHLTMHNAGNFPLLLENLERGLHLLITTNFKNLGCDCVITVAINIILALFLFSPDR